MTVTRIFSCERKPVLHSFNMNACNVAKIFLLIVAFRGTASVGIPEYLQECYATEGVVNNENKLPKNMFTLIEILRKIERNEHLSMSLEMFSSALIHRFRSDGIVKSMDINNRDIVPYYVNDFTSAKLIVINELIPGNIERFPNDSISYTERCSLHTMISTNVNKLRRGDESKTCKIASGGYQRRYLRELQYSDCPTEEGVVLTESGTINVGSVIAGIASGLETQLVMLKHLFKNNIQKDFEILQSSVDNRWFSSLTGDLAEVTLRQGPTRRFALAIDGNWNSTIIPKWYFIHKNQNTEELIRYELTAAELKGGMDGLILSQKIKGWYTRFHDLRISQVLDMYYSTRGIFDTSINSCNRHQLFNDIVTESKLKNETLAASRILDKFSIAEASFNDSILQIYSSNVVQEFSKYIATLTDVSTTKCKLDNYDNNNNNYFSPYYHSSVDLTIFLDTSWDYNVIQNLLVKILEGIEIGQYNSNFTLLNAKDGNIIINSTNSILDFYSLFNRSIYERSPKGLDIPIIFGALEHLQPRKLRQEKDEGLGGQKADVILIMSNNNNNVNDNRDYYNQQMERIKKEVPDCVILFYVNGRKERWTDFVDDSENNLFSFDIGLESTVTLNLVSRIKQVPKRLINSQCGSNYVASGPIISYDDYVQPFGINFYRMHANYFFGGDQYKMPKLKIRSSGSETLEICLSRQILNIDTINKRKTGVYCKNFTGNTFETTLSCYDAYYIQDCKPYYISVRAFNAPVYFTCTDVKYCRFPDMIKYRISYENLICSSAMMTFLTPVALILVLTNYLL